MRVYACVSSGPGLGLDPAALSKEGSEGPLSWPWPRDAHEHGSTCRGHIGTYVILHLWPNPRPGSVSQGSCCSLGLNSLKENVPVSWHSGPFQPFDSTSMVYDVLSPGRPRLVACTLLVLSF